jgi:CHASE2 domain-containing sensor protein
MSKLAIFKITGKDSNLGYDVILEIFNESKSSSSLHSQIKGTLPSATKLLESYHTWERLYGENSRYARIKKISETTKNLSDIISEKNKNESEFQASFKFASQQLMSSFNSWLNAESFSQIREKLIGSIGHEDKIEKETVRLILQIEDLKLHHLPWHLSDFLTQYTSNEVTLSSLNHQEVERPKSLKSKVKILAILGNNEGINIEEDRNILESLQNAEIKFLVQPVRQEITDRLWEQHWDILFFAGHSNSHNDTGKIWINGSDCLSLEDLNCGLKKAIKNGLNVAIFNSCDGLKLAESLGNLNIPQVIVMREKVPDLVAQSFLKEFLQSYARGNSFGKSVREAREKLQGQEDKFPCATWLPTVYQQGTNPPPTWEELQGEGKTKQRQLKTSLLIGLGTTVAVTATRLVGLLQPLELSAYDMTVRARPLEKPDSNILVIGITNEEAQKEKQNRTQPGFSLSDETLDRLLKKIEPYQPRTIGMDIYQDHEIDLNKYTAINKGFESGKLVAVCKTKGALKATTSDREEIPPPSAASWFGFGDTIDDEDKIVRRHLISGGRQANQRESCNSGWSLSAVLLFNYLKLKDTDITSFITNNKLEIGRKIRHPLLGETLLQNSSQYLMTSTGGYQGLSSNTGGHVILLNYRVSEKNIGRSILEEAIPSITLNEILDLSEDKLKELVRDKIILIGVSEDPGDVVNTPYNIEIPGVFHQAQMISQLINAENRPLFWANPFGVDVLIVMLFSTGGAVLVCFVNRNWVLISSIGVAIAILCYGSVSLLAVYGCWFPLAPTLIGSLISGCFTKIYLLRGTKY